MQSKKKIYIDLEFFEGQGFQKQRFPIIEWIIKNEGRQATLREIGKEVGFDSNHPQKVKHYIAQMLDAGMIYKDGGKGYRLTPRFKKCIKIV